MRDDLFAREVRGAVEGGDVRGAVDRILSRHGAAFYGYIASLVQDESLAAEAFQLFSVRLWESLEGFRWESRLSTWAYRIARNAAYRTLEDPYRRRAARLGTVEQERLAASWTRTTTAAWRRTEAKQRLWEEVEGLSPEDREILVLRLGRKMSWTEVAAVIHGLEGHVEEKALARHAAKVRKRFQRLKEVLAKSMSASD